MRTNPDVKRLTLVRHIVIFSPQRLVLATKITTQQRLLMIDQVHQIHDRSGIGGGERSRSKRD
jgi:hypothetical protein